MMKRKVVDQDVAVANAKANERIRAFKHRFRDTWTWLTAQKDIGNEEIFRQTIAAYFKEVLKRFEGDQQTPGTIDWLVELDSQHFELSSDIDEAAGHVAKSLANLTEVLDYSEYYFQRDIRHQEDLEENELDFEADHEVRGRTQAERRDRIRRLEVQMRRFNTADRYTELGVDQIIVRERDVSHDD